MSMADEDSAEIEISCLGLYWTYNALWNNGVDVREESVLDITNKYRCIGIWFGPTLFTAPLFSASKSLSTSCALGLVHVCTMQQNMNITPSLSHAYSLHISHVSNRTIYYYTIVPPSCYMLQIDYHITSLSKCLMFHSVVYLYIWNTCMVLSQIVP